MPADDGWLAAAKEFPRENCEFCAQLLTDAVDGGYTETRLGGW